MLLYEDIFSPTGKGVELFSDAFPAKEVDGVVYEVDCQMITVREGNVDIGANPSQEEQTEALEDGAKQVNNVVHSSKLMEVHSFDKKSYLAHLKKYMANIKARMIAEKKTPEALKAFEDATNAYVKKTFKKRDNPNDPDYFEGVQYFVGDEIEDENLGEDKYMVALLKYRSDEITPYLIFWKHGTREVKL